MSFGAFCRPEKREVPKKKMCERFHAQPSLFCIVFLRPFCSLYVLCTLCFVDALVFSCVSSFGSVLFVHFFVVFVVRRLNKRKADASGSIWHAYFTIATFLKFFASESLSRGALRYSVDPRKRSETIGKKPLCHTTKQQPK